MIDNIRYPLLVLTFFYLAYGGYRRSFWRRKDLEAAVVSTTFPWILMGIAGAMFALIKILQLRAGQISGVDFSHLDYAIWSTSQGRLMEIPIVPNNASFLNFFGNHFSPILFVHVFFRWLVDSPVTSLIVHAVSLAIAIPLLHRLARQYVDPASASLLALVYFFSGSVASTLQFDIHQESFFPLAWAIFFCGLRGSVWQLFLGAGLIFSIKEDAGIYLFWAALCLAVFVRERRWILAPLAVLSLVYTVIALKVVMPMHQPTSAEVPYYFTMWARYGNSFSEVLWQMISHPHWVIADIIGNKALYKNLLPWAFMPAFHPMGLLALAPVAVSSTASGVQSGFGLYYGIILVPLFFYASCRFLEKSRKKTQWLCVALLFSAFVGGSYLRFPAPLPFLNNVLLVGPKIQEIKSEEVWVQSGLLPFLPYNSRWRRIDGLEQLTKLERGDAVFFSGLEQSTVQQSPEEISRLLLENGFRLVDDSDGWRHFRK